MTSGVDIMSGTNRKESTRRTAVVAAAVVVGLIGGGGLVLRGTEAVFSAEVTNGSNSWNTGTVAISTDLTGTAMFDSAVGKDGKMIPGQTLTKCIEVTYSGDVAATINLYTSASSETPVGGLITGAATEALDIEINEGSGTPAADAACTGFTAGTDIQAPGKLSAFTAKSTYASGISNWAAPATGTRKKMYRFKVTLPSTSTQMGAGATATFKWEAKTA
jgi:hypothetical protein